MKSMAFVICSEKLVFVFYGWSFREEEIWKEGVLGAYIDGDASREVEPVGQRNGGESCFHTILLQFWNDG